LATGSEVSLAVLAARLLEFEGVPTRVVSMPCVEWFDTQDGDYQSLVLPEAITARVSVEAGSTLGWHRFLCGGEAIGVDRFGLSGAADLVLEHCGITVQAVMDAVHRAASKQ
jgi:transketolase